MQPLELLEKLDGLMQKGYAADAKRLLEAELPAVREAPEVKPEAIAPLSEAGRVLSAANAAKVRAAMDALGELLAMAERPAPAEPEGEPAAEPMEAYEAAAVPIAGDLVPLVERAVSREGVATIKLIAPGRGASGTYSPELLERDGPKVFRKGLKMYADHPTPQEEAERPERSVRDLAGELVSDARWMREGPAGPGLYADAKVFRPFQPLIEELAPHIGVSIRARGRVKPDASGENIVEQLVSAQSVDFVTEPGAGGKVLQLLESARSASAQSLTETGKAPGGTMAVDEKEFADLREAFQSFKANTEARHTELTTKLSEAEGRANRAEQALVLREAQDVALEILEKIEGMDALTQRRIAESVAKRPPLTNGQLNREVFAPLVEAEARKEMQYLARVLRSGAIRGMGGLGSGSEGDDPVKLERELLEAFRGLGMSEQGAKIAAAGRSV